MARASSGYHVRLRAAAVPSLVSVYGYTLDASAVWEVVQVDGGYGRDGLHLQAPDSGRRIIAWRNQVVALPRCEYCGAEGHTKSKGTAATCSVRAAEVVELRKTQSARMAGRKRDAAGRLLGAV